MPSTFRLFAMTTSMFGCVIGHASAQEAQTQGPPAMARFLFHGKAENSGVGKASMRLTNTEFKDNSLYINGIYSNAGTTPGGFDAVCSTPDLDYERFTVGVRFKAHDFEKAKINLLTGGTSGRWFILERSHSGALRICLNNGADKFEVKGTHIDKDKWTTVVCSVDVPNRRMLASVNGQKTHTIELPKDFELRIIKFDAQKRDKLWSFANYGSGTVFHGLVEELVVFDKALTSEDLKAVFSPK
jgi:hypothetical protein